MAFTKRLRRDFSKIKKVIEIPNLIDVQKKSYDLFLQVDVPHDKRQNIGLQAVFKSVFPIKDFNETAALDFVSYDLGQPKYDVDECRQRGLTFSAPIKVTIRLVIWETNEETKQKSIQSVKEQEVYFGEIPLMTKNATFIINGTERVIVSQLHRSPGVFFDHDKGKSHSSGKVLFNARVIPYRGSWIDFEFDAKDILHVRIDRRRKLPATVLLKALGYDQEQLLNYFYPIETIRPSKDGALEKSVSEATLLGQRTEDDVLHPKTGEVLVKKHREIRQAAIKRIVQAGIKWLPVQQEALAGRVAAKDIVDPRSGEVIAECNEELTEEKVRAILDAGVKSFDLLYLESKGPSLRITLASDKIKTADQAIIEIYRRIRPGDPPTAETARTLFNQLFFDPDRYDLSKVGRLKLNHKLGLSKPLDQAVLDKEDIMECVRYLIDLKTGNGEIDDIDHLGNRRVRSVGELLENQYRVGLVRMERAIKERMSLQEVDTLMPHDLINSKPVSAVIKEFFGSSQLSQFMDQTNPVSEVTHKRRLSALGPGGLTRERAGFEVRDVHTTHYGRICPIETPEGPNIGLIASLSTFARVNEYGFIETPYKKVEGGRVSDEIHYLSALEEEQYAIAQANAPVDAKNKFINNLVSCRKAGEFVMLSPDEVEYMDVSPNQLVSVVASLIPFLEHDDANRALMGSNMQRQAVPLIRAEAPLVGTGIERTVAQDSGVAISAKSDGVVESVDASRIVVRTTGRSAAERTGTGVDIYNLVKFQRSNQSTCMNQKPIVKKGEKVRAGDIIADGPSTDQGELALGKNVLVAFLPWGGYNFEDSILCSERLVKQDLFTSIHIEEFETVARDTKLGKEEITRDIPNVGEEALKDLDESGIVRIGAFVCPGDILIGKITPKGETQLSPEEKLLRAIFGEKAGDVRDTSFHVPPGVEGVVIGDRVFQRKGVEKDQRTQEIEEKEVAKLTQDRDDEIKITRDSAHDKIKRILVGEKSATQIIGGGQRGVLLKKGQAIDEETLEAIPRSKWKDISIQAGEKKEAEIQKILQSMEDEVAAIATSFNDKIGRLKKGDELPVGVIKMVKVFVAIKRKLQVGDKMAGRHGNKGVVSMILPDADMPYLPDGTPVDIVLNPLGVPSRMNVGQVLETHLGWAAYGLGRKMREFLDGAPAPKDVRQRLKDIFRDAASQAVIEAMSNEDVMDAAEDTARGARMATPVFDGASEEEIQEALASAQLPIVGQTTLYDGRTGEPFEHKVTVGSMYMLKLHHLVDDKIHARSIGPYSLVTQQPLGGKAQFGGQRLGEMEVWAMEAYGAAYALQEFLTVKSDDVAGRTRMYETIVKGDNTLEPGLPESFNVLVKELQSLALDVELIEEPAE